MQLAIAAGVAVLATGLFLAPLGAQLDDQAMRRALAIAATTAAQPRLADDLLRLAALRRRPGAGRGGTRSGARRAPSTWWSWTRAGCAGRTPTPARSAGSSPPTRSDALAGHDVMEIDSGTLGRSARGKVPLRDGAWHGSSGAVSVGIEYDSVRARLLHAIPGLLAYAGGALAVGALAAYLIARRIHRQTRDLAFSDISALLAEREAMLHSIREGVVALDRRRPDQAPQRRGAAPARRRTRGGRAGPGRRCWARDVRPRCSRAGSRAPTC